MDLDTPFTGTLSVPDKLLPHGESPVELPDGQMVAQIRRDLLKWGSFGILDAAGQEVAIGRSAGFMRRAYTVARANGEVLLELRLGWRGTAGTSKVTLPDGGQVTVKGSSFRRRFRIRDGAGTEIGTIRATFSFLSFGGATYEVELQQPVLSTVQVVGLTQCLRKAVTSSRSGNRHRRFGNVSRRGGLGTGGGGRGGGLRLGSISGSGRSGGRSRSRRR